MTYTDRRARRLVPNIEHFDPNFNWPVARTGRRWRQPAQCSKWPCGSGSAGCALRRTHEPWVQASDANALDQASVLPSVQRRSRTRRIPLNCQRA